MSDIHRPAGQPCTTIRAGTASGRWSTLRERLRLTLTTGSYEQRQAWLDAWAAHIEDLEQRAGRQGHDDL